MAMKEHHGVVLKKFEELKKWQKVQEEKMRLEQEAQRELLNSAQRRMYEEYSRDLTGSSQGSYNGDSLHQTSLESFPRIDSPNEISPLPAEAGRRSPVHRCVSHDDVPVPSPHKDFNELLSEKLRQTSVDKPKERAPSKIVKRPFLKKGQGLVKYRLNPDLKKPVPKPASTGKASNNKTSNSILNKPAQITVNQLSNRNNSDSNENQIQATWANVLSKNPNESLASEPLDLRSITPDQRNWMPSSSEASPNKLVGSNKMTKKELEDLRLFELLEQKAANSSFCSSSSTIARLLERSHQSTPNKTSARERQLTLKDIQLSPLRPVPHFDRGHHVRFADQDNYDFFKKPADVSDCNPSSCEDSVDLGEPQARTDVPLYIGRDANGAKSHVPIERPDSSAPAESSSNFQDSEVWSDGGSSSADEDRSESDTEDETSSGVAEKTIEGVAETIEDVGTEPVPAPRPPSPTEQLVRTAVEGVVYKSDLLRRRLRELEAEIETFRAENANLARSRRAHEADVAKFAKDKRESEREFREKQEALAGVLDAERKKLAKDKKVFEKYYKELKGQPSKMEREEIAALKLQVESLRESLATKDARWGATQVRTRDRLKQLEAENAELRTQLRDVKARQKRSASLPNAAPSRVLDTKVIHAINAHIGRLRPSDLRDVAGVGKPRPSEPRDVGKPRPSALLNRPVWGARNAPNAAAPSKNPKAAAASNIRRIKSVPDVRPRFGAAVRTETRRLNGGDSTSESDSESDEAPVDPNALARVERLRRTVYDAYYDDAPGGRSVAAVADSIGDKENDGGARNRDVDDDVPDYLKAISKKIDHYKATLRLDDGKGDNSQGSSTASNHSSSSLPSDPRQDSFERTAENVPPLRQIIGDRDAAGSAGDMTPTETVKANGNREKTFADGRKEIWYPSGNVKKVSADKSVVKIVYFNGDVKETIGKSGLVKYYYAETKTWHSTYKDGTEILEFANGQTERRTADGVSEITFPNGCVRVICADGRDEWTMPDGTRITTSASGEKVARLANGQREIHTATHKRREYPDGTVKLVYPDGLQETRYANGRIRLKDKDGKLVMDSADEAT